MYSTRGLGDATSAATCPSLQQLMGIVDSTDPCQAGIAVPAAPSCYPSNFIGPIPPGASYCSAPVGIPATPVSGGCPAGSTCSIVAGVPNTAVYVLAAILGSFMLYGAISR